MLCRWLCGACGVDAPAGALSIGPVEPEDRLEIAEAAVSEYALIAALIAVAAIAAFSLVGTSLSTTFSTIAGQL